MNTKGTFYKHTP